MFQCDDNKIKIKSIFILLLIIMTYEELVCINIIYFWPIIISWMSEIIKTYYLEHKAIFEANFNIVLESFNMEAIHKMRTTTKRLRGLFQLIEFLSSEKFKAKKQLRKIRTVFKHSGKIREIQIEQEIVAHYEIILSTPFPEYKEYLKRREHKEIAAFLKSIPKISKRKKILNHQYILDTISNLPPKKIVSKTFSFIEWKKESIKKLNNLPISNTRIHQNRTYLKQLYYLHDTLVLLTNKNDILNINKERLREIEQQIGNWHDLVNSGIYLNAFFKTKDGEKTTVYKNLNKQILADRQAMRKELKEIIRTEIAAL